MRARRISPLAGCALALVIGLSGCSSSGLTSTPTGGSTSPASDMSSGGPSSLASATSSSLSLVGLGDSIPGALGCSDPCRSYVVAYGQAASKALGKAVTVTNLATNDSLESGQLLERIRSEQAHQEALAKADLITLTVGFNDWQGPCELTGAQDCLQGGLKTVESNLSQILDEVTKLRSGKPTAIRVTDYYNMNIGNPNSPSDWSFEPTPTTVAAFNAVFAKSLEDFNTMICRVAKAHAATCVDLVTGFNGPRGNKDAGKLLGDDHLHPSEAGHARIADAIAAAGYAPLP